MLRWTDVRSIATVELGADDEIMKRWKVLIDTMLL